jgi:hypothetical protein
MAFTADTHMRGTAQSVPSISCRLNLGYRYLRLRVDETYVMRVFPSPPSYLIFSQGQLSDKKGVDLHIDERRCDYHFPKIL